MPRFISLTLLLKVAIAGIAGTAMMTLFVNSISKKSKKKCK